MCVTSSPPVPAAQRVGDVSDPAYYSLRLFISSCRIASGHSGRLIFAVRQPKRECLDATCRQS